MIRYFKFVPVKPFCLFRQNDYGNKYMNLKPPKTLEVVYFNKIKVDKNPVG